jgi:hypothetical protein
MLKVNYKITLGADKFESGEKNILLDLYMNASFFSPVNYCRILLSPDTELSLKPGDEVKVELGYDDKLSLIFTGKANTVEEGVYHKRIDALSSFSALAGAYINILYEKQDAGAIVSDLADKFEIQKDKVEQGIKFPTYMLSANKSVWEHLSGLSKECGFDFYADTEDKLIFKPYEAEKTHTLEYGVAILNLTKRSVDTFVDGVEVYGESPAGQGQGEDASSWFTTKEVKGSAGKSSGQVIRIASPVARNKDMAQKIADSIMKAHSVKEKGEIRLIGSAEIALGHEIKINKMPQDSQNGAVKPVNIRHRVNMKKGFITNISYELIT